MFADFGEEKLGTVADHHVPRFGCHCNLQRLRHGWQSAHSGVDPCECNRDSLDVGTVNLNAPPTAKKVAERKHPVQMYPQKSPSKYKTRKP
mmetsp:Transcript_16423/g.24095  ORF Transcript_16423/g.24095 Transcript_16423/m.24095 type:complete len:91 (-) Transcript_16423:231-503(-)